MSWEDPDQAMKKKHSREEYCQRLLTSLILAAPDPGWNKRKKPSETGRIFLNRLYKHTTGDELDGNPEFINEFALPGDPPRIGEKSPDYGVLTDDLLWVIELKTEKKSHKSGQLTDYEALGHFHYPDHKYDLLYLTPVMNRVVPDSFNLCRFAHVFWQEILDLISDLWADSPFDEERRLYSALARELLDLDTPPKVFRGRRDVVGSALMAATEVQETGTQAAIEIDVGGLEELMELRTRIGEALLRSSDSPNVKPWIWYSETSGGRPLTERGASNGCELRLSKYKNT